MVNFPFFKKRMFFNKVPYDDGFKVSAVVVENHSFRSTLKLYEYARPLLNK